jgi:hypothetical protein
MLRGPQHQHGGRLEVAGAVVRDLHDDAFAGDPVLDEDHAPILGVPDRPTPIGEAGELELDRHKWPVVGAAALATASLRNRLRHDRCREPRFVEPGRGSVEGGHRSILLARRGVAPTRRVRSMAAGGSED